MSFIRRKIELTFQLGTGSFGASGQDTVTVSDLRVQCSISKTNGPTLGEANVRVYGLTPSLLNQLSALNKAAMALRKNRLTIKAGDDASGLAIVFEGQIALGQIDMNSAPDVALNIVALAGFLERLKTEEPISYPGGADAAVIIQNIAARMGYGFENSGVSVMLSTPYYSGSLMEQAQRCAADAGINLVVDDGEPGKHVLAIWPKGSVRRGSGPLISPATGLVGYPNYGTDKNAGIMVKCRFNPSLRTGFAVRVESDLHVANGQWAVYELTHELDSEVPGGVWFSHFAGLPYGQ